MAGQATLPTTITGQVTLPDTGMSSDELGRLAAYLFGIGFLLVLIGRSVGRDES